MMTVPQKKYFCQRIDEITGQKISELKEVPAHTNKGIAQMGLANGRIEYPEELTKIHKAIDLILGDGKEIGWTNRDLGSIVIEPMLKGYIEYKAELEDEITEQNNKISNQRNKLHEEATRIKDVAMFGSEEAAQAMLKDFVEWQVD